MQRQRCRGRKWDENTIKAQRWLDLSLRLVEPAVVAILQFDGAADEG